VLYFPFPEAAPGKSEAMNDLRRILAGHSAQYERADISYDTSSKALAECYIGMLDLILKSVGETAEQSRA